MTERIDHVVRAIELGELATESWNADRPETALAQMTGAQVHATLALVEQQRIANLIAFHAEVAEVDGQGGYEVRAGIREGLGLS